MSNWTHAQCETCWIDREGTWVPFTSGDGEYLKSVRIPVTVKPDPDDPQIKRCCFCGAPTIIGIFVRADRKDALFCRGHEEQDE